MGLGGSFGADPLAFFFVFSGAAPGDMIGLAFAAVHFPLYASDQDKVLKLELFTVKFKSLLSLVGILVLDRLLFSS